MSLKNSISKYENIKPSLLKTELRKDLLSHFRKIGILTKSGKRVDFGNGNKIITRKKYTYIRKKRFEENQSFLTKNIKLLEKHFANGKEVCVEKISPKLILVRASSLESRIFRLATLLWSVPVSAGFGRRLRFIIVDQHNEKLIGLLALGDPVFNLRVRDDFIGWSLTDRKERLVNLMDAYVLGAVPPYNSILGGKLIACLVRTQEIRNIFNKRYGNMTGIISGKEKKPRLVCVTTTSALGRSSVYNRLKLNGEAIFDSIGFTSGYGHFHIPNEIFLGMRKLLQLKGHKYFNDYQFGKGPNWKIRSICAALDIIGLNRNILKHGAKREVFICYLACNASKLLRGEQSRPNYKGLLSVEEITEIVKKRWIIPRSERFPLYYSWSIEDTERLIFET